MGAWISWFDSHVYWQPVWAYFHIFPTMLWSWVTSFAWGNAPFALVFSDPPWNSWYYSKLQLPYTISLHWECLEWTNYNHSRLDSPMLLMKFTEPSLFTSSDGNHKNAVEALFNFSCLMNILVPLSSACLLLETKPVDLVIKLICVEALELPPISKKKLNLFFHPSMEIGEICKTISLRTWRLKPIQVKWVSKNLKFWKQSWYFASTLINKS